MVHMQTYGACHKLIEESLLGAGAIKGQDGLNGKSAYETAVDGGYTGTAEEFSEALNPEETNINFGGIWEE